MFRETSICRTCGKEFEITPEFTSMCPRCSYETDKDYKIVRDYIRATPGLTASQVANATGVSVAKILRYTKEDLIDKI